jgi:hypothetical protein
METRIAIRLRKLSKKAGAFSGLLIFFLTNTMGQKKQINARVPDTLHDLINERARLIEETQGGYLGLIAQWWFAQGQPPVNDYEARLLSQQKVNGVKVDA